EVVRRALMEALGQRSVPELQLRQAETVLSGPLAASLPGVLAGGIYPNRWTPSLSVLAPSRSESDVGQVPSNPDVPLKADATGMVRPETAPADIRPMIPLGQFRDTFIIAIDDEGVAIVDQHVAHERVLFERVMEKLTAGRLESQRLLVPLMVDLAPGAYQALID